MNKSVKNDRLTDWIATDSDPLFLPERLAMEEGFSCIAGIDEAGAGPLIGPLVVAGVIFPSNIVQIPYVFDSKQIPEHQRDAIRERILAIPGIRYEIVEISAREVDALNIFQARMQGMARVAQLLAEADLYLIDGNRRPKTIQKPVKTIVKGDAKSASIAAASLLAKTYRDDWMRDYAKAHPEYGFELHKGYGTSQHMKAIEMYGVLPEHRRSFRPIKKDDSEMLDQPDLF